MAPNPWHPGQNWRRGPSSEETVMFRRTRLWVILVVAIGMAALLAVPEIAHAGIAFNGID
jgi:hypothetical protein